MPNAKQQKSIKS